MEATMPKNRSPSNKEQQRRRGGADNALTLRDAAIGIILLTLLAVWTVQFVRQLIRNPSGLLPLQLIALGLAILLYVWMAVDGRR